MCTKWFACSHGESGAEIRTQTCSPALLITNSAWAEAQQSRPMLALSYQSNSGWQQLSVRAKLTERSVLVPTTASEGCNFGMVNIHITKQEVMCLIKTRSLLTNKNNFLPFSTITRSTDNRSLLWCYYHMALTHSHQKHKKMFQSSPSSWILHLNILDWRNNLLLIIL